MSNTKLKTLKSFCKKYKMKGKKKNTVRKRNISKQGFGLHNSFGLDNKEKATPVFQEYIITTYFGKNLICGSWFQEVSG